jgi:hypothetical protein
LRLVKARLNPATAAIAPKVKTTTLFLRDIGLTPALSIARVNPKSFSVSC